MGSLSLPSPWGGMTRKQSDIVSANSSSCHYRYKYIHIHICMCFAFGSELAGQKWSHASIAFCIASAPSVWSYKAAALSNMQSAWQLCNIRMHIQNKQSANVILYAGSLNSSWDSGWLPLNGDHCMCVTAPKFAPAKTIEACCPLFVKTALLAAWWWIFSILATLRLTIPAQTTKFRWRLPALIGGYTAKTIPLVSCNSREIRPLRSKSSAEKASFDLAAADPFLKVKFQTALNGEYQAMTKVECQAMHRPRKRVSKTCHTFPMLVKLQ